jgi:hypothetical protein
MILVDDTEVVHGVVTNKRMIPTYNININMSSIWLFQTLIEATIDVRTTDGYLLRMFCIGFTSKRQNQIKKTCYAQTTQVRK